MKFTMAWTSIASQNVVLRWVILALTGCCLLLAIGMVRLAVRHPLIIDRQCFSKVIDPAGSKHTVGEIAQFAEVAIAQRFNSDAKDSQYFLSQKEQVFRLKEQKALLVKKMTQKVIVNSVRIEGPKAKVDTDRLISVGKIRSAFAFPLVVEISKVSRTDTNPYGLILSRVVQANKKEQGEKRN